MPHAYVSIERLADEALLQYGVDYSARLRTLPFTGLVRYALLCHYHTSYLNADFYTAYPRPELAHLVMETNRPMHRGEQIVDEVLHFLMTTEVTALTGVTFESIMEMDFGLYRQLKKKYDEIEKPKREMLAKLQSQMQDGNAALTKQQQAIIQQRMQNERARLRRR